MNREDYLDGTIDHQTFYCAVADAIGRRAIEHLVGRIADVPTLRKNLEIDTHLNNIPLQRWDNMHDAIWDLVREKGSSLMELTWNGAPLGPKKVAWSLGETVCVLKAAARRMVEESSVGV